MDIISFLMQDIFGLVHFNDETYTNCFYCQGENIFFLMYPVFLEKSK